MNRKIRILASSICLALGWSQAGPAHAQSPSTNWMPSSSSQPVISSVPAAQPVTSMAGMQAAEAPKVPSTPQAPVRPTPEQMAQAPAPFAEAAPAGTEGPGGYAPQMLGDSLAFRTSEVGLQQVIISGPPISVSSRSTTVSIPASSLAGSAFKIADNESPRPEDRVYLNFNYFTGVLHSLQPLTFPPNQVRFARQIFGYERTFGDGNYSLQVRMPFFQLHNSDIRALDQSDIGNISLISKAILLGDASSDSLICGGVVLTLPTGPDVPVFATFSNLVGGTVTAQVDSINPTIIQPYVGFLASSDGDAYVHGFSSLAFSSDDSVPHIWFNDIAAGYYLYEGSRVAVVPTAELHLTTALGQRGSEGFPVGVIDTLVTTLGVHLLWNDGGRLTFGWGFPLTGPQPFSNELTVQFNYPLGPRG